MIKDEQKGRNISARMHLDLPLLTGIILLCGLGLIFLYSASGQDTGQVIRQAIRIGVGLTFMLLLAQVTPDKLRFWSPAFFTIAIILLVIVLIEGQIGKGAQRWLSLGFFRFQPSEIMKLALPMMVAWYLVKNPLPPTWGRILVAGGLILMPTLMIAKQPDLGTALLVGVSGLFILFLGGLSWRLIFGIVLITIPTGWAMWKWGMQEYQRGRVLTFLNPERDPLGSGYHIIQSKIAIGSGGMYGKGWMNGTQSQLEFLPERTTDFIFAVISEEFGFVGVLLLLSLYIFIIMRGLYIASHGQDSYSRLLAGALILVFFVYLFVNTGMVSGILPVVGVPLPLVSYGGTSLVTILSGFGILMSIHTHKKLMQT